MSTPFILTATFVFFLYPFEKSSDFSIKKEKEVKNNSTMSVDLHLRSNNNITTGYSDDTKKVQDNTKIINLVIPSQAIIESTMEIEDWMISQKTENSNNDF
jgi:uncharacterized protein YeeX (DUF496 family)